VLEVGSRGMLQLREVRIVHEAASCRVLYISDLHLSRHTSRIIDQVVQAAHSSQPNLILFGGDLVDNQSGLAALTLLTRTLTAEHPVWAIPGNHDQAVGCPRVRDTLECAGSLWIADTVCEFGNLSVSRSPDLPPDPYRYSLLCAHYPTIFPSAVRAGCDLVLAGHLHGSQLHVANVNGRSYPGAWCYRWNGERFQQGKTTMLVSRGVNDTLPIRWNCAREVILCHIG